MAKKLSKDVEEAIAYAPIEFVSAEERVKEDDNAEISVNMDYEFPKYKVREFDTSSTEWRCTMCGVVYDRQNGNFMQSNGSRLWRANNGYLPICKTCVQYLHASYTGLYNGNEEHALRRLCEIFDWFYCEEASVMALKQSRGEKSRVCWYPSKLLYSTITEKGTSYTDTIKNDFKNHEIIRSAKDLEKPKHDSDESPADEFVVTKDMLKMWGSGYTPEQYEFLTNEYEDWVTHNECKTKAQRELFMNLCLAQLNTRISQKEGNQKAAADWMKVFQDLLGSNNLKPTQTADNAMSSAQTFGTLIKKVEETKPIAEPEPEWRDVDGIRKYLNTWFRGGLAKALHIKHDCVPLYEEAVKEYERYTVSPPRVESEAADTSIFDTIEDGDADADPR